MKTIKTSWKNLFALVMCLSFCACSDDSNNNFNDSDSGAMPIKRISEIYYDIFTPEDNISGIDFSCRIDYTVDGRVLRYRGYNAGDINNVIGNTWFNENDWKLDRTFVDYQYDKVVTIEDMEDDKNKETYVHFLNEDGFVYATASEDGYQEFFKYKDGYLIGWKDNHAAYEYTYKNGNLSEITYSYGYDSTSDSYSDTMEHTQITYGNIPNKGKIVDLARFVSIHDDYYSDWAALMHAGILGNPNNLLPTMIHRIVFHYYYTFDYELDDEGFVKSVYVTKTDYGLNKTSTFKLCYKYRE